MSKSSGSTRSRVGASSPEGGNFRVTEKIRMREVWDAVQDKLGKALDRSWNPTVNLKIGTLTVDISSSNPNKYGVITSDINVSDIMGNVSEVYAVSVHNADSGKVKLISEVKALTLQHLRDYDTARELVDEDLYNKYEKR